MSLVLLEFGVVEEGKRDDFENLKCCSFNHDSVLLQDD